MSLPGVFEPGGLPAFLAAGHAVDIQDVYSTDPKGTGHTRKRRVSTIAPRIVNVGRVLTPDQAFAYDDWFENSIVVGQTHFTASVANLGAGQLYYEAVWLQPYQAEAFATPKGVHWRLTGQLLLIGDGVVERPEDGLLAVEFSAGLTGSATVVIPVLLAVEFSAGLLPATLLQTEFTAGLITIIPSYLQREDGTDYEREDGTKIQREVP